MAEYRCYDDFDDPERYLVYPTSNRTCYENGAWSGPPPVCADRTTMKNGIMYRNAISGARFTCCDALILGVPTVKPANYSLVQGTLDQSWVEIGIMHSDCRVSKNTKDNAKNVRLTHTYMRRVHFKSIEYSSVATIDVPQNLSKFVQFRLIFR